MINERNKLNNLLLNVKKTKMIVVLILMSVVVIDAQDLTTDHDLVLTLDKAISIALNENYDMKLGRLDILNADAQITEAYAGAFPKLDFNGQYTRNLKSPVLFLPPNTAFNPGPTTQTLSLGADNSFNVGASLSQTIFDPRLGTAISVAKKYSNFTELTTESTRDEVIAKVKQAFYDALLTQKLVDVNQKAYEVAKANYENTGLRFKQGVASEYDYLRAEVQLANVEPALIEAKNNIKLANNNLKNLLTIDLNTKIKVEGEFKAEQVSAELLDKSNELLQDKNPLLQSLGIQKLMLEDNIDLEQAAYFPTLKAFGNYNWQSEDNTFKFGDYNWANTITVGLQISYPIFDGFKRGAKIEQAKIQLESFEVSKNQIEEGLKISLLQSKLKMEEALDRIDAQKKSVVQAEKALEIAQTRYNKGVGTQLEILDTQNSLTQTRVNYERALYDFLTAKTQFEKIIGSIE